MDHSCQCVIWTSGHAIFKKHSFLGFTFFKNHFLPTITTICWRNHSCFCCLLFWCNKIYRIGIPSIVDAFTKPSENLDFLLKILFTGFTLGAGFKGGEVTPLFFVGATLGSALSLYVPLPISLLAGMGFVAVFSGATHTPIACTIMGIELFGIESTLFIGLSCFIAYISSGSIGIYHSQTVRGIKHQLYEKFKINKLDDF